MVIECDINNSADEEYVDTDDKNLMIMMFVYRDKLEYYLQVRCGSRMDVSVYRS